MPSQNDTPLPPRFRTDEGFARELDAQDPLADLRQRFHIPCRGDGTPLIYLCGNSLGLQPKGARARVEQELADWENLAVRAHFAGTAPWYSYHELFRETGAGVVGARPGEVVMMNSLTTNLHLMFVSFYRPTAERYKILIEDAAFPSDSYAVRSQLSVHGYDPADALIIAKPRVGEHTIRTEDLEAILEQEGDGIALVFLSGVQYFTGQFFDVSRITAAARRRGCRVGFDLAHAAGNVVLHLHDWDIDFAVWCSYKYLNSGPGGVGGCFVHERHAHRPDLPRFAGWWGNDPEERFRMHLLPEFQPQPGAAGWQLSNPPILAMAPLRASLEIFEEVGMTRLREKSRLLTSYLEYLVDGIASDRYEIITPRNFDERGCQLSILVREGASGLVRELEREGIVCDFREPDVIRAAPVPLYNTFHDVFSFANVLVHHR